MIHSTRRLRCLSAHPRPARKKKRRRLLRSSAIDEDAAGEADVVVSGTDAVVRDAADAGEGAVLRQDDLVIAEEDLSFDDRIEERVCGVIFWGEKFVLLLVTSFHSSLWIS